MRKKTLQTRKRISREDSSGRRILAILGLFTVDESERTVESVAKVLGVSATTAYRYFSELTNAGLISPIGDARYTLGPAIIQMDRQIQACDPMLGAARTVMVDLLQYAPEGSTLLLCRLFHDRVMCVHQVIGRGPQKPVSYERGRLMPLYRGATSKIILAHLPPRHLKVLYGHDATEIAKVDLGESWEEFRSTLAKLRRVGVCITRGEIDSGRVGVAAPIFDRDGAVLGSLSYAVPVSRVNQMVIGRLVSFVQAGAQEIERAMGGAVSRRPPLKITQWPKYRSVKR
jgi:DNA-binding IclR family transcriptional regulator